MKSIYDLNFQEILAFIKGFGEPDYRCEQVWEGLYSNHYTQWSNFSSLPINLRELFYKNFSIASLDQEHVQYSQDQNTKKVLFKLFDNEFIETVMLKKGNRVTLCVSTQVGCPVKCVFCATGNLHFARNLTCGEIIEQVVTYVRDLDISGEKVTNIVFMGMGEPLLNYENTLRAVKIVTSGHGLNFSPRRVTLSTIGIVPKIRKLADEGLPINLAVSLHSASDEIRRNLVPISKNYLISDLISACRYYFSRTGRRVTFEYTLIEGVNDSISQGKDLANLLSDLTCHVNLIALNPIPQYQEVAPPFRTIKDFGKILLNHGIPVSIRDSQGSDIQAGCGQLAGQKR